MGVSRLLKLWPLICVGWVLLIFFSSWVIHNGVFVSITIQEWNPLRWGIPGIVIHSSVFVSYFSKLILVRTWFSPSWCSHFFYYFFLHFKKKILLQTIVKIRTPWVRFPYVLCHHPLTKFHTQQGWWKLAQIILCLIDMGVII